MTSQDLTGMPLKQGDTADFFCILDPAALNIGINSSNVSLSLRLTDYAGIRYGVINAVGGVHVQLTDSKFEVLYVFLI